MTKPVSLSTAAPPGALRAPFREAPPPATPLPRDLYVPSPALSRSSSLARTALLVGLGVAALAGPAWAAGPVAAQEPPPPSVSTPAPAPTAQPGFSLCPDPAQDRDSTRVKPRGDEEISPSSASDRPIGQAPEGSRLEVHLVNDSFKDPLNLFGSSHKRPGTPYQDDDGFTAEARIDYSCTLGDRQWVLSARGQILTERGAWVKGPDYQGRRADVLDLTYQVNHRQALSEDGRTVLSYGLGGGLQLVGDMGGREVQEFVHRYGPFGGRLTEDGLQYNYTSHGVTVTPVATGGAKVLRALDEEARLNIKGEVGAFIPLGPGLGAVQGVVGVEYRPFDRLRVDAGASLTGAWSNHRALDFLAADVQGVRPGGYLEAEYAGKYVRPFVRVDVGGVRGEPVYRLGIIIPLGGGDRPWVDSPWK